MHRTYVWPYQMHGSIGPSCAVADYNDAGLTVWSGTQNPYPMRRDLALLLHLPEEQIDVSGWRRPAVTAATAPMTSQPTPRCCRGPSAVPSASS